MDLLQQIQDLLPELTPGERAVAEYILQYPSDVIRFQSGPLADFCKTSRSNVVRFCKKMGFSGYMDFRSELTRSLKNRPAQGRPDTSDVLDTYIRTLEKMRFLYDSPAMSRSADLLLRAKRILVMGVFHSSLAARQMAMRLNRNMIDAFAVDDVTIMEAYGGMLTDKDAVILFSVQGWKDNYENSLELFQTWHVPVILVTFNPKPQIARWCREIIILPSAVHEQSVGSVDDEPIFFIFSEMLIELMNQKTYAITHEE